MRRPWKIPAVRRTQYFFYYHGSAVSHFLRRRIRPTGMGVLMGVGIATFVAIGNPETAVFQLFCLGLALCAAGLVWLPLRHAKVEVTRELPAYATVASPLRYRLHLKNLRGRPLHSVGLLEVPPDPRPEKRTFVERIEPGEGERNAFDRFFAWYRWTWLCEIRTPFQQGPESPATEVKAHGAATVTMELIPNRRGLIRLNDLRILLPEPLGLFQRSIRARAQADTVAILPRRYRLPPFELPGSARFQPGGDAASRNTGQSGEFVGLRDYQAGDPLRLIHWPTWARTGRPVVRELEDTFYPRYGLVLDTFAHSENEAFFEDAVSIAASLISAIDTNESLIDLMFIAGAEQVVSAGRGVGRAESLLEVLAGVEAAPDEDFKGLMRLVLRHSEDLAGCMCVFAGWTPSRAAFMRQMGQAGVECAAVVVTDNAPETPPPHCYFVSPATLADDLMRLPAQL